MSVVKRIIQDNIERAKVDELLADEYEQAGYGGLQLTKTPMGAQINLFAMRPGRVIGKRGRAIKDASERLERELGLTNPQITVVEVEVPELNPRIMASRIANALERGIHFRRAIFWSLSRIMESGAIGCEVILKGPLRSARSRFEKVVEGYVPKSGEPALRWVKKATIHVKMKRGILGVTVKIVPPDAKFPDKISLDNLPEIEYQLPIHEPTETPIQETLVEELPAIPETVQPEQTEQPLQDETPKASKPVQLEPNEQTLEDSTAIPETVQPEEPQKEETVPESEPSEQPTLEETEKESDQLELVEQPAEIEEPKIEQETEPVIEKESIDEVEFKETSPETVPDKDPEEEKTEE